MSEVDLTEKVDRDPALSSSEKETGITMMGDEKRFRIYSAKPTVVKSLLEHNHFDMIWARVLEDDETEKVSCRSELKDTNADIVAILGTMPIGTLTIKSKPRANNHQSSIISTETVDSSVFEDSD